MFIVILPYVHIDVSNGHGHSASVSVVRTKSLPPSNYPVVDNVVFALFAALLSHPVVSFHVVVVPLHSVSTVRHHYYK